MQDQPKTILDPAFGLGIFYDELCKLDLTYQPTFVGYEIDEHILSYLYHKANQANFEIIAADYLESDHHLFDAIICNPPYMRFQKFLKRHNILPQIEEKLGIRLTGYANLSSIFLIKALNKLNHGGRLAFIMPFEFFNTGYGTEIKKKLLENYLLKQIITFSNEKDIFPDATTTICLLLCQNDNQNNAIKITSIRSNEEINKITDISSYYQHKISSQDLPYDQKWSPIISSLITENIIPQGFCRVSFYGHFKRGIATGANDFFALSKSDIEKYNLGQKC
jgi:adenine-specific DNA-methyltransferase